MLLNVKGSSFYPVALSNAPPLSMQSRPRAWCQLARRREHCTAAEIERSGKANLTKV